jgi:tetratricopeptide (TPR) repeat protein
MATGESVDRAVSLFERASTLDPEYAKAWAGLGMAYRIKGQFLSVPELAFKGIDALRRAIALSPALGAAHAELGLAYVSVGHFDEGIEQIQEAIRREPTNASAHAALGRAYWLGKGRLDAGIVELQHALAINPEAGYSHLQLSLLYAINGELDLAEAAARRAVELQERYLSGSEGIQVVGAHLRLGYVYYRQGRYEDAIREYEREMLFIASSGHVLRERTFIEANQKLSAAAWRKGDRDAANLYFSRAVDGFKERLSRGADDGATKYYMAALYGLRGDAVQAARYLDESLREFRDLNVVRAGLDPDFDPVRADPAFTAVLAATRA